MIDRRDQHHNWAIAQAKRLPPPWITCDAALTESFFLLEPRHVQFLIEILKRRDLTVAFNLAEELDPVLDLMEKYADVPMSLADACIVRMTEILGDPLVLTTDSDFRIYRRHGRRVVPCRMP